MTGRTYFVELVPTRLPEGNDVVTIEVFTSADQGSEPIPVTLLSRAAFSRVEKVMVAHDSETCDADGCDRPIGLHLVMEGDQDWEANTPFYVTDDGRALCEEHEDTA